MRHSLIPEKVETLAHKIALVLQTIGVCFFTYVGSTGWVFWCSFFFGWSAAALIQKHRKERKAKASIKA